MPYLQPGPTHPPLDVIADQELYAERAHEAEMEDDYDEMRDEPSDSGWAKWAVLLVAGLGVLGLLLLAWMVVTYLLSALP